MNNTELKYMIALVKHNLSLEKKIEIYEAEYKFGNDLIKKALGNPTTPKSPNSAPTLDSAARS